MNSKIIIDFIRVRQYYKNIVVFLPLVFSVQLFSVDLIFMSILGFIALCLVSSGIYVKNDISDIELDRIHPSKKNRPLPAGLITKRQSWLIFIILSSIGFSIAFLLSWKFGIILILLFLSTEFYSRWAKNIILLDIFSIAGNFIIRVIAGIVLLESIFSPWAIIGIFFVALFLGFTKRKAELEFLKDASKDTRKVLNQYASFSLTSVIIVSAIMIIITYSLYAIDGPNDDWRLILTVPLVVFVIFRQLRVLSIDPMVAQKNEIFKDWQSAMAIIAFIGLLLYLIYLAPSEFFSS